MILANLLRYGRIAWMIKRKVLEDAAAALARQAAGVLIGPRQVGKTTLALEIAELHPGAIYLDLENQMSISYGYGADSRTAF